MRSLMLFLLLGCFLTNITSRPSQMEESNSDLEEAEYEDDSGATADESDHDEDTRFRDQEPTNREAEKPNSRQYANENTYQEANTEDVQSGPKHTDFSELEPNKNMDVREDQLDASINSNEEYQPYSKRRQSNKYIGNNEVNDQLEIGQHLTNRAQNKNHEFKINRRTAIELHNSPNVEGELMFDSNQESMSKLDNSKYNNNEGLDSNEQEHYIKQYYNTMQEENKGTVDGITYGNPHPSMFRDRRDIKESNNADPDERTNDEKNNMQIEKNTNEDEEAAIKRHIKKLSGDELEELLNSLNEEKRSLLKKIIDDNKTIDGSIDSINKREITKKAGAVEENNYMDGVQSDLSKLQGSSPSTDTNSESSVPQNSETTEINKQTDTSENTSSSKSEDSNVGPEIKASLESHSDESNGGKLDKNSLSCSSVVDTINQAESTSNDESISKNENKRETNLDDFALENESNLNEVGSLSNDQVYCQDQDLTQLKDDQIELRNNVQSYKREALAENQEDLSQSFKSLEESFPNSNAYHDSRSYSGPLVRVKRKDFNQMAKKRAAGVISDSKVGYIPYTAESEDEDNDEGSQFDDDGFYDRTYNFAKNKPVEDDSDNLQHNKRDSRFKSNSLFKTSDNNIERDSSLGSDTDSVISGVEGVDDNLMFSSGSRNKRNLDSSSDTRAIKENIPIQSSSLSGNELKMTHLNAAKYQEDDAFGPLPRNDEEVSGRYKRIRRLKQYHTSEQITN